MILNNVFVECVRNMDIHLINNFGVNLLVRDFEFIKEKMGAGYDFADSKFTESIFYFTNYVKLVNVNEDKVSEELKRYYEVMPFDEKGTEDGFLSANHLCGKDYIEIYVSGNEERNNITACQDNLGKGASGAAMECMNIML